MPELPEVETIARKLKPDLLGKRIVSVDIRWSRTVAHPSPRKFKEMIRNQKIKDVTRRAKYFILRLENSDLLVHLRMSGDLYIRDYPAAPEKHDRLIIKFANNRSLVFNDTRKFGRVWLTEMPDQVLGKLGPEPLGKDFTPDWLYTSLKQKHRQLKPLLLDQTFIAGLGNIYTDEALHMAKLHPLKPSASVTRNQAGALHAAIRTVLKQGIRRNGASIDWVYRGGEYQNYFRVYDREGEPCIVCSRRIQKLVVGQRGTHICPNCQKIR